MRLFRLFPSICFYYSKRMLQICLIALRSFSLHAFSWWNRFGFSTTCTVRISGIWAFVSLKKIHDSAATVKRLTFGVNGSIWATCGIGPLSLYHNKSKTGNFHLSFYLSLLFILSIINLSTSVDYCPMRDSFYLKLFSVFNSSGILWKFQNIVECCGLLFVSFVVGYFKDSSALPKIYWGLKILFG